MLKKVSLLWLPVGLQSSRGHFICQKFYYNLYNPKALWVTSLHCTRKFTLAALYNFVQSLITFNCMFKYKIRCEEFNTSNTCIHDNSFTHLKSIGYFIISAKSQDEIHETEINQTIHEK